MKFSQERGRWMLSRNDFYKSSKAVGRFQAAMTLVEVIVALSILSGGIIGVAGTFSMCSRAGSLNLRLGEAAMIAERELRLAVATAGDSSRAFSGESDLHKWNITFEDMSHGLVRVTVAVSWAQQGRDREFTLSEIFLPAQTGEEQES